MEAIDDYISQCGKGLTPTELIIVKDVAKFLLVQGVKIGGIYEHWKGTKYQVKGVSRNSENWDEYLVTYVETTNIEHEATRPLSYFLETINDKRYQGRRFKLIG